MQFRSCNELPRPYRPLLLYPFPAAATTLSYHYHGLDAASAQPALPPPPTARRRRGVLDGPRGVGGRSGGGEVDTGRAAERLEPARDPGRLRLPAPRPPLPRGTYARPSHMTHRLDWNGHLAIPKSAASPLLAFGSGTGLMVSLEI